MGVAAVNFLKIEIIFTGYRRIGHVCLEIHVSPDSIGYFQVEIIRKGCHGFCQRNHI